MRPSITRLRADMSYQLLTNDVISVIILCADVRTAVSLASTCHSIKLPALSRWHIVVEDSETHISMNITSSRPMLRADPPIMHGETVVSYGAAGSVRLTYDRGTLLHAMSADMAWLGSRFADIYNGSAIIGDKDGLCTIKHDDNSTTVFHEDRGRATFQSKPDDDSALGVLRWYARVVPDTEPVATAADVFRSLWSPPRWAQ